jgi:nicotinamidase-related amidase
MVIAGMESHICITQTALTALRSGYDVHVVADACCSRQQASSETALARLASAGAVVTTAESVAYELVGQAGTPEFKRLLAAVKGD